jgi:hypothetical protein
MATMRITEVTLRPTVRKFNVVGNYISGNNKQKRVPKFCTY